MASRVFHSFVAVAVILTSLTGATAASALEPRPTPPAPADSARVDTAPGDGAATTGALVEVTDLPGTTGSSFFVRDDAGETTAVDADAVEKVGAVAGDRVQIAGGELTVTSEVEPAAAGLAHSVDVVLVTVRMPAANGRPAYEARPQASADTAGTWISYASEYLRQASNGRVASISLGARAAITTAGSCRLDLAGSSGDLSVWNEAARAIRPGQTAASYENSGGRHLLVVFPEDCADAWEGSVGIANVGSDLAYGGNIALLDGGRGQRQIFLHEFGHNLSLRHADTYACLPLQRHWEGNQDCGFTPYADIYDPMGLVIDADVESPLFNAAHRNALGGYPQGALVTVEQNATASVTLRPASSSSGTLGVKIRDSNGWDYYLDLRNGRGSYESGAYYARGNGCDITGLCPRDFGVRVTQQHSKSTQSFAVASAQEDGDGYSLVAGDWLSSSEGTTCNIWLSVDDMPTDSGGRPTSATVTIRTGDKAPACGTSPDGVHPWFQAKYKELGGSSGRLGKPVGGLVCQSSACWQEFEGGVLTSDGSQIVMLSTAYVTTWLANGGPDGALGLVAGPESCFGTYCATPFSGGAITWVPGKGVTAVPVHPWFQAKWRELGGITGSIGTPTEPMRCQSSSCWQQFTGGVLTSDGRQIVRLSSAYVTTWTAWGGPDGDLGLVAGGESCFGTYCQASFVGGVIVWVPDSGVFPVAKKWFYPAWIARGGASGSLGLPTDAMKCQSAACYQVFRKGTLTSSTSGVVSLSSAYVSMWLAAGGPDGRLGLITGAEVCAGSFCQVSFQHGLMVWQPGSGVRILTGNEADEWRRTHPVNGSAR
ncbi:MAG: uncharacterized protein K0S37_641 [Microbacterium sp.]|jgi:hypothetical protein|nr:uncharacterized protein [Microbacterium sp.]